MMSFSIKSTRDRTPRAIARAGVWWEVQLLGFSSYLPMSSHAQTRELSRLHVIPNIATKWSRHTVEKSNHEKSSHCMSRLLVIRLLNSVPTPLVAMLGITYKRDNSLCLHMLRQGSCHACMLFPTLQQSGVGTLLRSRITRSRLIR